MGSRQSSSAATTGVPANNRAHVPTSAAPPAFERPILGPVTVEEVENVYAEVLPGFRDVSNAEKQVLFVRKLHLCTFTFDFSDPSTHVREKEIKRQALLELVEYVNTGQGKFTEAVSEDMIAMLTNNLFRSLPSSRVHGSDTEGFDPEEEEPLLEPAWPHLQVQCLCGITPDMTMGAKVGFYPGYLSVLLTAHYLFLWHFPHADCLRISFALRRIQ